MTARWATQPNPKTPSGGVAGEGPSVRRAPAHVPYWNAVLQEDYCHADGEPWPCLHYRQSRPPKCKCSHIKHDGQCWSRACGCRTYRPEKADQ